MTSKDFKRFSCAMAALEENFDHQCSSAKVQLYFSELSDFSIEEVELGVRKVLKEAVYPKFPTIGAIRQAILGSAEEQAIVAWHKVFKAVKIVGQYRSVQFDDPVIHSVIELMGGWENICIMEEKELQWRQREFISLYKVLQARNVKHPEYLFGISELQNIQRGYREAIEKPIKWPPIRTKELENSKGGRNAIVGR